MAWDIATDKHIFVFAGEFPKSLMVFFGYTIPNSHPDYQLNTHFPFTSAEMIKVSRHHRSTRIARDDAKRVEILLGGF